MAPIQGSLLRFAVLFSLLAASISSCGGDDLSGPAQNAIEVNVTTSGSPADPDGYSVSIDAGPALAIDVNGSITVEDLASGEHTVMLTGVAANCTVVGDNPRTLTVDAGETAETTFDVTCAAEAGNIAVTITTTGESLDPDGYLLSVNGGSGQAIGANATLTLSGIAPGQHSLTLSDVEPNCSLTTGNNPQSVTVSAAATVEVTFDLMCTSLGNRIAFDSDRDGNFEVYIMNADGSNVTRLTTDPAGDGAPSISPDGTRIVFNSERDGISEIYVMNADGSGQTRLTFEPQGRDLLPDWSPDGTRIAFISDRAGGDDIWIMNSDGSNPIQITSTIEEERDVKWSPDGTRLAYTTDVETGGILNAEIFVISSDGSGTPTNLTNNTETDSRPDWSPDGTQLSFTSARGGPLADTEIFVMDSDGSNQTPLTNSDDFENGSSWSPDGSQIAFETDGDGGLEIYVMNADGSGQTNLTNNPAIDERVDWGR